MANALKVLFLSPEVAPFAKSGGLGDVAGALPLSLKHYGVDIRIAMPFYRVVKEAEFDKRNLIRDLEVPLGPANLKADILETRLEDIPVYLLEREEMYDRPNLYGNSRGDYYDNLERFSFFGHAALSLAKHLDFAPDIVHCHDWQTGIVPALLKGPYSKVKGLSDAASVFTIHNMGYQGIFPGNKLAVTGLSPTGFFHPGGMEYWGNISLLKAGIIYSDAITTVSPTYAAEIQDTEHGMGMEGVLKGRASSLYGILNGVDYNKWDPVVDDYITTNYSAGFMSGKTRCKEALIKEMRLDPSLLKKPLCGVISRLDNQKGLDILIKILDDMVNLDVGLVVLGSGDERIQDDIKEAMDRHQGKIAAFMGFNDSLAHRIMAGADLLIIPSRYEPCGLTQMYALKYGTIPLVRATGGLNDTIETFDEKTGKGNGFKFRPDDSKALLNEIKRAVRLFKNKKVWKRLMLNAMAADFSWDRSAKAYLDLYNAISHRPSPIIRNQ